MILGTKSKFSAKIVIFFQKNLLMSKKSSNFAPDFGNELIFGVKNTASLAQSVRASDC